MFPRLVQLVLETLWIRDGKPDQIFFLLCSLSAALCAETCYVLFPQAVLLSVFSCQILSQSPCLYVLATSRSRQGISPSTTAQPLSSCLAASRELSPMIYQLWSLSVSSWSVLFAADPLIESHSPSESVLFCLVPRSLFVPPSVHLAPFIIISMSVFPPTHCPLFNSPVQACDPGF